MTITETSRSEPASDEAIDEFADKVFADLLGAMSTYATTIGVTLWLVRRPSRRIFDDVGRVG